MRAGGWRVVADAVQMLSRMLAHVHCRLPGCNAMQPPTPHHRRRDHVFLNKAIGGTTSGIFATCAEKLVPQVGWGGWGGGGTGPFAMEGSYRVLCARLSTAVPHGGRALCPRPPNARRRTWWWWS